MFTCLYVHNPDLIEEPALKSFALGILKVCDIAREKVNKAAVFEEVRSFLQHVTVCACVLLHWKALFMCKCVNSLRYIYIIVVIIGVSAHWYLCKYLIINR